MEAPQHPLVIPGFELEVGPILVLFLIALMCVYQGFCGVTVLADCCAPNRLFGILCAQCYYYYTTYEEDRPALRFFVLTIWYAASNHIIFLAE